MKAECPECKHEFQTIDVDAVMGERKLIHEVLEESKTAAKYKAERDKAKKLADELAETLSDLWHHYSLTGAAYEIVEAALAKWRGAKKDKNEECKLCEFESGWGHQTCRGCGQSFFETASVIARPE